MWAADAGTEEPLIGYQVTRKASDWLLTGRDIQEESKEESGGKECSREGETGNCLRCSIRDNDAIRCNKSRADARCWPDTVSWPLIGHSSALSLADDDRRVSTLAMIVAQNNFRWRRPRNLS